MKICLGDNERMCVLGPQLKLKMNTFTGIVVHIQQPVELVKVVELVNALPRLRRYQHLSYATRIRTISTFQSNKEIPPDAQLPTSKKSYRKNEDLAVFEDWEDNGEVGLGDRILHLLQRWQVENVVLFVARQDDSLTRHMIGQDLFKLVLETAKLALEQYYISNMKPPDTAKLELFDATGGAKYIISPRGEQPQVSICLMTSGNTPTWPKNHQPTSNGGRKGTKTGRVNHFQHNSTCTAKESKVLDNSNVQTNQLDAEILNEGIEWLGITREEWQVLRSIRVPVKDLHYLLMCLVVLVENCDEVPKSGEDFVTSPYSWPRCREMLHNSSTWSKRMSTLHGSQLLKSQITILRSIFQEPHFDEAAFVRISIAGCKIFKWVQRLMDEYDEYELGLGKPVPLPSPSSSLVQFSSSSPVLKPQPPPQQPRIPKSQIKRQLLSSPKSLSIQRSVDGDSALLRELNALMDNHSNKSRIIDKGRMLLSK